MFCTIRREAVVDPARQGVDIFPDPDMGQAAGLGSNYRPPSDVNREICKEMKARPIYQVELENACFTLTNDHYSLVGGASAAEQLAVAFTGHISNCEEVAELYNLGPESGADANLVFSLYNEGFSDSYGDDSDQPATFLNALEGDWAMVLYDARSGYLLAARSPSGRAKIYWGLDKDERSLVFSSDPLHQAATESDFPKGCFFESQLIEGQGESRLELFTRANPAKRAVNTVPLVDSHGHLQGIMVTSPSGADLCGAPMDDAVEA